MDDPKGGEDLPLPPAARFLKRLVLAMAVVMIAAFLALIAVALRLLTAEVPILPAEIRLPAGVAAQAFTQAQDWYAVVTDDDRILIFDRATGALRQEVTITR